MQEPSCICKYHDFVQGLIIGDTVQLEICSTCHHDLSSLIYRQLAHRQTANSLTAAAFFSVSSKRFRYLEWCCNAYALQPAGYPRMLHSTLLSHTFIGFCTLSLMKRNEEEARQVEYNPIDSQLPVKLRLLKAAQKQAANNSSSCM